MARGVFLGIDIGTSGCKAAAVDEDGAIVATAWSGYTAFYGNDGEVSQDPDDWLAAVEATLKDVADVVRAEGYFIEAIAPTAPAHTAVLVDESGLALDRAILPYDGRSAATARALEVDWRSLSDRTFARLGPAWTFPQLVWLSRRRPGYWDRIAHVLITKDFVRHQLTGDVATDPSDAAGTAMYDQRGGTWIEETCREAGLRPAQMPPILSARSSLRGLSDTWAKRTGIAAGTPVCVGCTDTAAELISLGADSPGQSMIKIASTGTVVAVLAEPRPDRRTMTYPHVAEGRWFTLAATNSAATAYKWLRETMFGGSAQIESATYAEMDRVASEVAAGSAGVLFLPYLTGERSPYWDSDLRAAFLGVSAAHRREHFVRAVLEGVAFSLRDCREILSELGVLVEDPYFIGGGLGSQLWASILASVLHVRGSLVDRSGPAVGAAVIAASGVGTILSVPKKITIVEPNPAWGAVYDRMHGLYRQAAHDLTAISHQLARTSLE
jgi:xylulokinase